MQRLGQHFLRNKVVLGKIVSALDLKKGGVVLEIGAGHGELTRELVFGLELLGSRNKSEIIAIEKDPRLISGLESLGFGGVEIVQGDALKELPKIVEAHKLKTKTYKLIGNIPYYITGHLLRIIGELKNKPALSVFAVQKEVAERIVALPPHMNRLAASVQVWADVKIIANISRTAFSPSPKVDSAAITLKTKEKIPDLSIYYRTLRAVFRQPRKTILNNISEGLGKPREETTSCLKKLGIDPQSRPQDLSIEDVVRLSKTFSPSSS